MNESSFHTTTPAPIPSPDDHSRASFSQPGTCAVVFGHFLLFALLGQLALPALCFLNPTNHRARTPDPLGEIFLWTAIALPLLLAVVGAVAALWKPIHWLGHGVNIALTVVAMIGLGLLDLIALVLWSLAGYC